MSSEGLGRWTQTVLYCLPAAIHEGSDTCRLELNNVPVLAFSLKSPHTVTIDFQPDWV